MPSRGTSWAQQRSLSRTVRDWSSPSASREGEALGPLPGVPLDTAVASGHSHSARAPHYLLSLIPPLLTAAQRGHKDTVYLGVQLSPPRDGSSQHRGRYYFRRGGQITELLL